MKQSLLIIIFLLTQITTTAQANFLKDIDHDGISDTVYMDSIKSRIVCKLSSQKFKPISSKPIEILNYFSGIINSKNGFIFFNDWMRAGYKNQFRYNAKTKKIQLIGMSKYEFGNVVGDGSGESSVNLVTNSYIGNWSYYVMEKDLLIKIPTIKASMKFKAINLEDFGEDNYFEFSDKCRKLFEKHKDISKRKRQ